MQASEVQKMILWLLLCVQGQAAACLDISTDFSDPRYWKDESAHSQAIAGTTVWLGSYLRWPNCSIAPERLSAIPDCPAGTRFWQDGRLGTLSTEAQTNRRQC